MVFGSYDPLSGSPVLLTATVTVSCVTLSAPIAAIPYTLSLGPSQTNGTMTRALGGPLGARPPVQPLHQHRAQRGLGQRQQRHADGRQQRHAGLAGRARRQGPHGVRRTAGAARTCASAAYADHDSSSTIGLLARLAGAQGQAFERALVGRQVHQLVPGETVRFAAAGRGGAPRCRDRRASVPAPEIRPGHRAGRRSPGCHRPTGCRAAPDRSRRRAPPPPLRHASTSAPLMRRAPAMLRSSLKIAPSKPSCRRRMSFSQRAEKPAGSASTFG